MSIRFFDFVFSLVGLLVLLPVLLLLTLIGFADTGSPLFLQKRVGRNKRRFTLIKFRTMKPDTPNVSTHEVNKTAITSYGAFLRRTKLDELPQLINVLFGQMSLVGPRPNLPTQTELIQERESRGVYKARPGITGLAQTLEIDMSTPKLLAETDQKMLNELTVGMYFTYIFQTVFGKGQGDRVKA